MCESWADGREKTGERERREGGRERERERERERRERERGGERERARERERADSVFFVLLFVSCVLNSFTEEVNSSEVPSMYRVD